MPFPPEFLRELGERNRIEEIAAPYVNLRRRGKNLVGLCPFHNEKTPSFCIYPENNSYFCFGCNKGGDVISFVMGVENLDFSEAVKLLAQRAGMALPEDGADLSMSRLRGRILEINRESGRFCPRRRARQGWIISGAGAWTQRPSGISAWAIRRKAATP